LLSGRGARSLFAERQRSSLFAEQSWLTCVAYTMSFSSAQVIFLALRLVCMMSVSTAGLEIEAEAAGSQDAAVGVSSNMGGMTAPSYQKVSSYFSEFLMRLLRMFSKDSTLLENWGSFMIRCVCLCLWVDCLCVGGKERERNVGHISDSPLSHLLPV